MELSREEVERRWPTLWPFALVGTACVIVGGLVAAVSNPFSFEMGPWLSAYLVLVGGVAQMALAAGQSYMARRPPQSGMIAWQLITWNIGGLVVVVGSLVESPALTTVGGLLVAAALALFLTGVKSAVDRSPNWLLMAYRGLAVFVLLSVPVGLILSWVRHA